MSETKIRALLLEGNADDAGSIREMLSDLDDTHISVHLECVDELSTGLTYLKENNVDVVLANLSLPDSEGIETFERMQHHAPMIPIIIMSGLEHEATALAAVKKGAQDYLVKGEVDGKTLMRVMRYAMERKKYEQLKDDFIGTVSHELRTPMTIIRSAVSQVADGIHGSVNYEQIKFLSTAIRGIDRLNNVIDALLDVSKLEAQKVELKKEEIDIVALVKEISASFSLIALQKKLKISEKYSEAKIEVYADRSKLFQIFTNLISNALKYTDAGHIEISIVSRKEEIECNVKDTGRGISKSDLPKVFTKFVQFGRTEGGGQRGTGLGLAICMGIVELHGGTICVESVLGEGTTFRFTLPNQTSKQLLKECLTQSIKNSEDGGIFSVLMFELEKFDVLLKKKGQAEMSSLFFDLGELMKQTLRNEVDHVIRASHTIFVIIPGTRSETALSVAARIKKNVDEYLERHHLNEQTNLISKVITYPEDGNDTESLLKQIEEKMTQEKRDAQRSV